MGKMTELKKFRLQAEKAFRLNRRFLTDKEYKKFLSVIAAVGASEIDLSDKFTDDC